MPEKKIKIAIVGFGNVGRGVYRAIKNNPDMKLGAIFTRNPSRVIDELRHSFDSSIEASSIRNANSKLDLRLIRDFNWVDVAILCGGSKEDLPEQGPLFAKHYSTVDSFDTHADIPDYFVKMDKIARRAGNVAIISAGWDPGTFSLERVLGDSFVPGSERYTFWGPGVSQGHSDAIRKVEGVADAIQYTMPIPSAIDRVRKGENPELATKDKHWRDCYVALKPGADPEKVKQSIITMPNYFADYNTQVTFETLEQVAERKRSMPHGGFVITGGRTGKAGNKAIIEYKNDWASNPEATGNILVACARANYKLQSEGRKGAFTMLDVPPAYLSSRSRDELLEEVYVKTLSYKMEDERYEFVEPLSPVFEDEEQVKEVARKFGTPVYVNSQKLLEKQARQALAFPSAFGLTVRYAMKANPNQNILRIFDRMGLHIDASSKYEVERALLAGISPKKIMLTSQLAPEDIEKALGAGVLYNACSLSQLENFGRHFPSGDVCVRMNQGLGSGGTNRTNTGGPSSSFGIWHEEIDSVLAIAACGNLNIRRVHTHIGSGSDPEVWKKVALMSLGIVEKIILAGHNVETLNLGGGYKVGRMNYEKSTNLEECGAPVKEAFLEFAHRTGRKLKLEIEPGTFLVANAGAVIAKVSDIKYTSKYNFIITNSGMTEVTRPSLYGAQHPISIVSFNPTRQLEDYIISGKCCESGDILTPLIGDSEGLRTRRLLKASIGDLVVIGGAGAYCSGMSTKNYNSYPEASEILLDGNRACRLIRKRQTLSQIIANEIRVE